MQFTVQPIDRILSSKFEKLLTKCQIEHHIDLFRAIAKYIISSKQHSSIVDLGNPPAIIVSEIQLRCLKAALHHSTDDVESSNFIKFILESIFKRRSQTGDHFEKMLVLRVLSQLNSANIRNDQKINLQNCINSAEQEYRSQPIGWHDESIESQYHEKNRKNILLHKCVKQSVDNGKKLKSNNEFGHILDALEMQTKKLKEMHHSDFDRGIDCKLYSDQIDRIINCLKLFKK